MAKFNNATSILLLIVVAAIVAVLFHAPVAQDPAYHLFADTRTIGGVSNFWNVASNIPFLLVGIHGLSRIGNLSIPRTRAGYAALCAGVLLVAFGSGYYHLAPSTPSLIWDRMPMTVAFMALFSLILDEREVLGRGRQTLWPLLGIGLASAAYWYWTETRGAGDLRPYILVQFLPMLLIPLALLFFRGSYLNNRLLVLALVFYGLAKVFEQFDSQIFQAVHLVSGHTLKHLVAGLAVLCIICAVPTKLRANHSWDATDTFPNLKGRVNGDEA